MSIQVSVLMHMFFRPRPGGLNYCVEDWGHVHEPEKDYETIAACDGILMARRAFGAAVEEHPHKRILLRHGMRVVLSSENFSERHDPLNYPSGE
ncbi:hypothetical protein ACN6KF_003070 [Labrys sp. La1]|uniref:hypothetical protein n=1 Tax=Labrys sp. La1 TaxID=3404917 RepID=UPI003EB7C4BB